MAADYVSPLKFLLWLRSLDTAPHGHDLYIIKLLQPRPGNVMLRLQMQPRLSRAII